jgi:hypothetical protein
VAAQGHNLSYIFYLFIVSQVGWQSSVDSRLLNVTQLKYNAKEGFDEKILMMNI